MHHDGDGDRGSRVPAEEPRTRYRAREGPSFARPASPAWDTTSVRVSRVAKERFDRFRVAVSRGGRVIPHWEAFERLLDEAGVG